MTENLRPGDRIEWFLGPRRLRRTGTVLEIGYASGAVKVRVDGRKTAPVRLVHPECGPRKILAGG